MLEFLPENYSGSHDDSDLGVICESSENDVLFLEQDGINIFSKNESIEKSFVNSILQDEFTKALGGLKFRF